MEQKTQEEIVITEQAPQREAGPLRLIATLGVAGFFSGLLLVSVFLATHPLIEAHRAKALREAIYQVLPGCARFQTLEYRGSQLVPLEEDTPPAAEGEAPQQIYAGYDDAGQFLGYAIRGEEPGFQDVIVAIFGYDPAEKKIVGMEVLESKETPGLGDKIMKDTDFLANFRSLSVEPSIEVVGEGMGQAANEVEAITGATISSRAVVRLMEKELAAWRPVIRDFQESSN